MAIHILNPDVCTGSYLIMANELLGILSIKNHSIIPFFNEYLNYEKAKQRIDKSLNDSRMYSIASICIYPICSLEMLKTLKYTYKVENLAT